MSRILILSHVFPPALDGGSTFLFQLAKHLAPRHSVSVLTSNCYSTDDFVKSQIKTIPVNQNPLSNTQIYRLPVSKTIHLPLRLFKKLRPGPQNPFITGPVFLPTDFLKTILKIKKQPPQVIISGPLPTAMPLYGHLLSRLFKAKHIVLPCFHTADFNFYHPCLLSVLKKTDLLLPFTAFEKNFYRQKFKIPSKKLYLYSGGVEKSFLTTDKKPLPRHLLFLGNHSAHKGIELLFSAYSRLFSSRPSLPPLIIAGQKTLYTPRIKKTFSLLPSPVKKQITFITHFDLSQKKQLLDQAYFLILPSNHESFGLVLVEALARSTPFLAAALPAIKEIQQKSRGGLIFKPNDPLDLSKKISVLLDNPQDTVKMGKMGYNWVSQNLTWEKLIFDFEKECQKKLLLKN
jgi:glycosyltransferase involved in cell wall biosynthesis